jgi:hypothetical protein
VGGIEQDSVWHNKFKDAARGLRLMVTVMVTVWVTDSMQTAQTLRGCAAVITLYNYYITKLRVNGTFLEVYIWKRINQMTKKRGQKGLDKNLADHPGRGQGTSVFLGLVRATLGGGFSASLDLAGIPAMPVSVIAVFMPGEGFQS